jgi:hypothetical protein
MGAGVAVAIAVGPPELELTHPDNKVTIAVIKMIKTTDIVSLLILGIRIPPRSFITGDNKKG